MQEQEIPHEHWCSICKRVEGCEDKFCRRQVWTVCVRPECKKLYEAATVHVYTSETYLPCCGRSRFETPGDRMTVDLTGVTCPGRPAELPQTDFPADAGYHHAKPNFVSQPAFVVVGAAPASITWAGASVKPRCVHGNLINEPCSKCEDEAAASRAPAAFNA